MDRRSFLAATVAAALPARSATKRIDRSRISAITDEVARSPADAIAFAHEFGLQWLSLRDVPAPLTSKKVGYHTLDAAALRQARGYCLLATAFLPLGFAELARNRRSPLFDWL